MSRYLHRTRALMLMTMLITMLMAFTLINLVSADEFNGTAYSDITPNGTAFNGTTYRLTSNQVEVVQPINASRLNLTLQDKAMNMTLVDMDGKAVDLKSSSTFWRGEYIYNLIFDDHTYGSLIYTLPHQGQEFVLSPGGVPVCVILPPGYTTGQRALGIARPDPDVVHVDKDVTSLIWLKTSDDMVIAIDYYKADAPYDLMRFFEVIVVVSLLLLIEYYNSIRKLRSIRKKAEGT
jgi:hypothetical protein